MRISHNDQSPSGRLIRILTVDVLWAVRGVTKIAGYEKYLFAYKRDPYNIKKRPIDLVYALGKFILKTSHG